MGILFRILLGGCLVGIFAFMISISYFQQGENLNIPYSKNSASGSVTAYGSGETFHMEQISLFETLYSSTGTQSLDTQQDTLSLTIESGNKYLTSFRDISKKYVFLGEGYRIEQEGVGEVFIDTVTAPGKVFVLPMNTSVHLILTDAEGTQEYTDIFLQPHMYLEFQPARGKFLKNVDVVRIETIYKLGYLPERITQVMNDDFVQKYTSADDFLISTIEKVSKNYDKKQKELTYILSQEVGKIPGYDMMSRYINLFVNDEKKKVFYKNIILENVILMGKSDEYDEKIIGQIRRDLETLKRLDKTSYDEMREFIAYFSTLIYADFEKESVIPKIYFAQMLGGKEEKNNWYFQIYGFSLYGKYDFSGNFSTFHAQKFLQSFNPFYIFQEEIASYGLLRYQYFSHFIDKQLSFQLTQELSRDGAQSIVNTFESLIQAINLSYSDESTDRVTALYIYSGVLKDVSKFLRFELFNKERGDGNLLVLKQGTNITNVQMNQMLTYISSIQTFLADSKIFLESKNSRDISVKDEIQESFKALEEYFDAFKNYEKYLRDYNVEKRDFFESGVFGSDGDTGLSVDHAKQYLKQFTGVDLSEVTIEVVDEYYYEIENIYVSGKHFNFDMYPYTSYKIENIIVDSNTRNFVYKLQNIEDDWAERIKTAGEKDRYKYDFSRFFLNTFFPNGDISGVEEYNVEEVKGEENKSEIVFKRDVLLGEKGEFSILSPDIDIKYQDITLIDTGASYDIVLSGIGFQENRDLKPRRGEIDSKYKFGDDNHYFYNVELLVFQGRDDINVPALDNNKIQIVGKIHLSEFVETMNDVFTDVSLYENLYSTLLSQYGDISISMSYSINGKKMSFKFDSGEKSYNILMTEGKISNIYIGTQKLLTEPITVLEVLNHLQ